MTSGRLDRAVYDRIAARWHETRSALPAPLRALLDAVIVEHWEVDDASSRGHLAIIARRRVE